MIRLKRDRKEGCHAELRKVLGEVELPTIPAVVTEAIDRLADPESDLKEVAGVIGRDPGLSARLLSMVNSAVYAPRNPIVAVDRAVMMLGRNHVESLLVSLAASRAVNEVAASAFDLAAFWTTASWRAATASEVSQRVDRDRRAENFTASLLLDVAVPVIVRCRPEYEEVLRRWREGAGRLEELERELFGFTHRTVTAWMFEEWGFPPSLRTAVAEEGHPETDPVEYPVVRIVAELAAPEEVDEVVARVAELLDRVFGLGVDECQDLILRARDTSASLARSLT